MNLKKYIKPKGEVDAQYAEEDREHYNSLLQRVQSNSTCCAQSKRRIMLWKILTPILTAACVLAVTLTCVLIPRGNEDYIYYDDLIVNEISTFSSVQQDVKYFNFDLLESTADDINLSYYNKNDNKLYYSFNARVDVSLIYITIVINKNYNYNFEMHPEIFSKDLDNYTLNYSSENNRGSSTINYRGWVKCNTETVYFDFTQYLILGDEAFFESIQKAIAVK